MCSEAVSEFKPQTTEGLALLEAVIILRQVGDAAFVREALLEHLRSRQAMMLSWTDEAPSKHPER